MAERPLTPDEAALWARVLASVRPIKPSHPVKPTALAAPAGKPGAVVDQVARDIAKAALKSALVARSGAMPPATIKAAVKFVAKAPASKLNATLDGSWDKQLARGMVSPDRSIDLHGHNLTTAYATLDTALARAIADGDRVVLLITGKPPRAESERPHARGAIRAAVGDWLAGSRHATAIAAVRSAHPRHGGAGALFLVLRRPRVIKGY